MINFTKNKIGNFFFLLHANYTNKKNVRKIKMFGMLKTNF